MSLFDHTIKELQEKLENKEISVKDLVSESIERIKEVDGEVNAFLTFDEERAMKQAEELDQAAEKANLFGLPFAYKDDIVTKGIRTTAASRILENFNDPLYDAAVVEKMNEEKAVSLGKLNLDEFAMGSGTESSAFGPTKNPWNTDYVPGGSGAAAAVAAGEVLFALGSDTGGSIRKPAAYCGVVGMKPTYGRVSRFGLIAFASSMDQIGPITRNVEDNARVLEAIAGRDERDATSSDVDVPAFADALNKDVKGMKIAVPKEYLGEGVSQEVKDAVTAALKVYESLGATWEEVSLPHTKYALPVYTIISSAEASSGLARFDGVRYGFRSENAKNMIDMYKMTRGEGFGDEVKRRIVLGTFVTESIYFEDYFKKAQKVRTLIKEDYDKIFEEYDLIVGPTTPGTAYKTSEQTGEPLVGYENNILTIPANLAGLPALSLPCGFGENGLPLGLQIIGKHFDEENIYRAAYAFEQATDYHKQRPQLGGAAK